ncbi:MarR family winged helix-turn-helix transcriptional regulator [Sphingomonas oryzagri]
MDRTTLTAALKPLERRRLIEVKPDPRDRRSRLLALTAEGREILAASVPIWRATHHEVETALAGADALRAALIALA